MRLTIDPATCQTSALSARPEEEPCQTLELDDTPLGAGGQGTVYRVTRRAGLPVSDLLVKIFAQALPPGLLHIVAALHKGSRTLPLKQCPALRALPLFVLHGTLDGQPCQGYVMRYVTGEPLSTILDSQRVHYVQLPFQERLALCQQYAEAMHLLSSLGIVHADLNGQNLMIDMAQRALAIIDLDGGCVASSAMPPAVVGKWEPDWMAPEVWQTYRQTSGHPTLKPSIEVDLWAIACGIHHLLFGLAPFFFIAETPEISVYLGQCRWPHFPPRPGIKTRNERAVPYYEATYKRAGDLQRYFQGAFNAGYDNPGRRPAAYLWIQALDAQHRSLQDEEVLQSLPLEILVGLYRARRRRPQASRRDLLARVRRLASPQPPSRPVRWHIGSPLIVFPPGVKQQYVRVWNHADHRRAFAPAGLPGYRITTVFGEPLPETQPVVGADNTLELTIMALAPGAGSRFFPTWHIDQDTSPIAVLHLPPLPSRPAGAAPLTLRVHTWQEPRRSRRRPQPLHLIQIGASMPPDTAPDTHQLDALDLGPGATFHAVLRGEGYGLHNEQTIAEAFYTNHLPMPCRVALHIRLSQTQGVQADLLVGMIRLPQWHVVLLPT